MSEATDFDITPGDIPADLPPVTENHAGFVNDFDPEFPGSTRDAPYGFFDDGRPRKRRPKGGSTKGTGNRMPASAKQAESAAALLASMNGLIGMAFNLAGMHESALNLAANNERFQSMATEALLADPALCKKILSTGATGGKAGLAMAYIMLGVNVFPGMKDEYRRNHPKEVESYVD
jgi:hypothetical protein